MIANEIPASSSPVANFCPIPGPRSPSLIQTAANTGASTMIENGLTDWKNSGEIEIPTSSSDVRSAANVVSVVAACSNSMKNSIAATNSGMYALTCCFSVGVTSGLRSSIVKYAIGARKHRYEIASTTGFGPMPPEIHADTANTTTSNAITAPLIFSIVGRSSAVSGFGGASPRPCRVRRPSTYATSASVIPTAAAANATWKPNSRRRNPTTNGALNEPMLIPM